MVTEGVVLGHRVSGRGIEVDRAKIEAIEKLPYPKDIRGYHKGLPFQPLWRTSCRAAHSCKGITIWILLTNFI